MRSQFKPLQSKGLKIQIAQGDHGLKGSEIGKKTGKLSLESDNYKNYQQRLNAGLVPDEKKPGRKKSKKKKSKNRKRKNEDDVTKKCMAGLTFDTQLELIDCYKLIRLDKGATSTPYIEAMKHFFGTDIFERDYKTKNQRKNARKRLKDILGDEIRLRYAHLCGLGNDKRWTAGSQPRNPMEPLIAKHLNRLKNNKIKISTHLKITTALQITKAGGIPTQWTSDCNDLIGILSKDEMKECMGLIDESQDVLSDDNNNNNNKKKGYIWSPGKSWRTRFDSRYGFGFGTEHGTSTNIVCLLTQLEPALLMCYCLRDLYDIPCGEASMKQATGKK